MLYANVKIAREYIQHCLLSPQPAVRDIFFQALSLTTPLLQPLKNVDNNGFRISSVLYGRVL
jgi:hypothetical protein